MKGILVVRLSGGLCNRLRVLLSAIGYCEATGRALLVHWAKEAYLDVPLASLFRHQYREVGVIPNFVLMQIANKSGKQFGHDSMHLDMRDWLIYVDTSDTFSCVDTYPRPLISYLSRIAPVAAIQDRVTQFYLDYFAGKKVVGVSIRFRNAHHKTLEASPPDWFVRRIREIGEIDPGICFFLSADCKEVSHEIRSKTKAHIVELPKTYLFNSLEGLQESICDLYLLSRANYILGSYWSSFSDMGFWMRGEAAYETSQERRDEESIRHSLQWRLPATFSFQEESEFPRVFRTSS